MNGSGKLSFGILGVLLLCAGILYATSSVHTSNKALTVIKLPLPPGATSVNSVPSNMIVNFSFHATDSKDSYPRYWDVWVDKYPGNYLGGGIYSNTPTYSQIHYSGDTFYLTSAPTLKDGTHNIYFTVTQSGGNAYGTYSGTFNTVAITNFGSGYVTATSPSGTYTGLNSTHGVKITIDVTGAAVYLNSAKTVKI